MAKEVINTTDQISELPDFLVHRILTFLKSPIDLVRTSVLSKRWFDLTASFPILNFSECVFESAICASRASSNSGNVRDTKFYKYMAYTVSRFCEQEDLSVHSFKLMTSTHYGSTEVDIIEKCIESVLSKGVKVLYLNLFNPRGPVYCLPNTLFSVSSLRSFTASFCRLPLSMMVGAVKFKSLKLLLLFRVVIDDEVIKRMISGCPFLKILKLSLCFGLKRFCVSGLQKLTCVWFYYNQGVERIDIDVPNLCECGIFVQGAPCINLGSCNQLTRLTYHGYPFPTSKSFADFLSSLPVLKRLELRIPDPYILKLSSHSLRYLVIHRECDLERIDINTPNLLLFRYIDQSSKLENVSTVFKATMECNWMNNTFRFQKFRRFLDKTNRFKVLRLHLPTDFSIDIEQPRVTEAPTYDLDHVVLNIRSLDNLSIYEALLDAILWCCGPRSLTLISDFSAIKFEERSRVVQFTCNKLLRQEAKGKTNIQFAMSSYKPKMIFSSSESVPTTLQRITFIKQQGIPEEGLNDLTVKAMKMWTRDEHLN